MGLNSESHFQCSSPDDQLIFPKDFEVMIKGDGQPSPPPPASQSSSISGTPPTTPLTPSTPQSNPGTPLAPGGAAPITPLGPLSTPSPSNPGPYRHRLPSFTESDSQSSTRDTDTASLSDSQSDATSVCSSTADWVNLDISPLVKVELKEAIRARRKTKGLPQVEVDFTPRLPSKLTPEEEERRQVQKERNRAAAAKCRSKKRSAVTQLVEDAQMLENANAALREEMKALEAERVKLQFLLDMHSPNCIIQKTPDTSTGSPDIQPPQKAQSLACSQPLVQSLTHEAVTAQGGTMVTEVSPSRTTSIAMTESSQSYESLSYMPLTPLTTHSHSSTEPSTPVMTPTSTDAPLFPTKAASNLSTSSIVEPIFHTPAVFYPSSLALAADSQSTLTTEKLIFPPAVPPTPEMEEDDPMSLSFVKQYLGDDAFLTTDLPLPGTVDTCVTDNLLSDSFTCEMDVTHMPNATNIDQSITAIGQSLGVVNTCLSSGHSEQIHPSQFFSPSSPITQLHTTHTSGIVQTIPESPPSLSFSDLLGIPPQDMDREAGDMLTSEASSQSAISREGETFATSGVQQDSENRQPKSMADTVEWSNTS